MISPGFFLGRPLRDRDVEHAGVEGSLKVAGVVPGLRFTFEVALMLNLLVRRLDPRATAIAH
jgi:hypothetical protein